MNRRQSFLAYAALLASVITFACSFARATSGQDGVPQPPAVGRYQLSTPADGNVYVADTATGRTWQYRNNRTWYDMGSPVPTK